MKKLFKTIQGPLEVAGKVTHEILDKSIEGASDLFVSTFKLGNELFFNGSPTTVKLFMLIFAHRETVAEHFYPTRKIKKKLEQDAENIFLKFDLYLAERKKKRFFKKLAVALSILPHQKYMTQKFMDQSMEIEGVKKSVDEAELLKNYQVLAKRIDELESEEEILEHKRELRYFLLMKIELERFDAIEDYLDVAEIAQVEDVKILKAIWRGRIGEVEEGAKLLSEAAVENVPGALEELSLLLDEAKEKKTLSPELAQINQSHFGSFLGARYKNKVKTLPVNFFMFKKEQIMDIINKGKVNE